MKTREIKKVADEDVLEVMSQPDDDDDDDDLNLEEEDPAFALNLKEDGSIALPVVDAGEEKDIAEDDDDDNDDDDDLVYEYTTYNANENYDGGGGEEEDDEFLDDSYPTLRLNTPLFRKIGDKNKMIQERARKHVIQEEQKMLETETETDSDTELT
jgi:hypothetical protein